MSKICISSLPTVTISGNRSRNRGHSFVELQWTGKPLHLTKIVFSCIVLGIVLPHRLVVVIVVKSTSAPTSIHTIACLIIVCLGPFYFLFLFSIGGLFQIQIDIIGAHELF